MHFEINGSLTRETFWISLHVFTLQRELQLKVLPVFEIMSDVNSKNFVLAMGMN